VPDKLLADSTKLLLTKPAHQLEKLTAAFQIEVVETDLPAETEGLAEHLAAPIRL